MQHPISELAEFYDALSRYLTGGGRDPGGSDAYAMHRALRDPHGRRETPDPQVLNELIAEEIGEQAPLAILDAGCGWGGTLLHLARTREISGFGITLSGVQAKTATGAAKKFGLSGRLTFVEGDFDRHEFPSDAFDVIICIESLTHSLDKVATARHFARSLKDGGALLVIDDVTAARGRVEDPEAFARFMSCWRYTDVPSTDERLEIFRKAGLRGGILRDLTELYTPRPDIDLDRLVAEAKGQIDDLDDSGSPERYAIEAIIGGYMLEKLYNRGFMKYLMLKATKDYSKAP